MHLVIILFQCTITQLYFYIQVYITCLIVCPFIKENQIIIQLDMKAVPLNDSDNCIFNSQTSAVLMWKSYELLGWK